MTRVAAPFRKQKLQDGDVLITASQHPPHITHLRDGGAVAGRETYPVSKGGPIGGPPHERPGETAGRNWSGDGE